MNFWATIEHSLNYKYSGRFPEDIKIRFATCSGSSILLDEEMSSIRLEIQEAQKAFQSKKRKIPNHKLKGVGR